ncbi:hypothetical protein [Ralstonia solanacearum]|uniref:hypothetical protein n=1 Tax=Ralstonia solanacearum TaxID=305 RepID=UPI000AF4CCCC|nr:hypothetical protein [Ralstonia solanacearum]
MNTNLPSPQAAALEHWNKHREEWLAAALEWHDQVEAGCLPTPAQQGEHRKRLDDFEAESGRLWQVYRDLLK